MNRDALEGFLRDLGGLYAVRRIYPAGNEQVSRAARKASESLLAFGQRVRLARMGADVVVEDRTLEETPPGLAALFGRLAELGREGLQLDPGADAEDFVSWIEGVMSGEPSGGFGGRIRVGSLRLEPSQEPSGRRTETALGYLSLVPEVRQSLADLAEEKVEGLDRAREIVRIIAGQVATGGGKLFDPIRDLRAHDDYTFTHALNVCVLSAALCRVLGVAKALTDTIALAAFCHDIGKEKVPADILTKQGQLDPEERRIMDLHPAEGAAILLNLPERVHPILPIVAYQHHRAPDGSGYPSVPAAVTVHPASFLVAVADVYDALRTLRSYQSPLSAAGAFTTMLRQARQGALHPPYVGGFARLLGLLRPGDRVILSDGSGATVLGDGAKDSLRPVLQLESGQALRLEDTADLWIDAIEESEGAQAP